MQKYCNVYQITLGKSFNEQFDKVVDDNHHYKTSTFASCWFVTKDTMESFAMWQGYSDQNGIAI